MSSWNGDSYEERNNFWETPVNLKMKLQDWYNNQLCTDNCDEYIKPIHWPIALVLNENPNTLKYFVDNERKDISFVEGANTITYPGVTPELTAIGLINPSNFIMSSSNPLSNESYATTNDKSLESGIDNYLTKPYLLWTNNAYNGTAGNSWHVNASIGRVSYSFTNNVYGIRPVINLSEESPYLKGSGTLSDPYVIGLNNLVSDEDQIEEKYESPNTGDDSVVSVIIFSITSISIIYIFTNKQSIKNIFKL